MTDLRDDVSGIDSTVENLFDDQIIQNQRILTLEQTLHSLAVNLFEVQQDVQSKTVVLCFFFKIFNLGFLLFAPKVDFIFLLSVLQDAVFELDFRVTTLEENDDDIANLAELETRVSHLEMQAYAQIANITYLNTDASELQFVTAQQEARITANEERIEGTNFCSVYIAIHISKKLKQMPQQSTRKNL